MKMLQFQKMHGLGNDFIIFNGISQNISDYHKLAIKVCDRHFGIGADGMMIVEKSDQSDIKMVFYNADGSEAPMCGNGIRCFCKFVFDNNILQKKDFDVETLAGIMETEVMVKDNKVDKVTVNLGSPNYSVSKIPVDIIEEKYIDETIKILNKEYNISAVFLGSSHAIVYVDSLKDINVSKIGPLIENHKLFPNKINVNFCKVNNRNSIEVLTWERGVGQTLACGTGACSSAVVSSLLDKTENKVDVHLLGGVVKVEKRENNDVYMTGPAELICKGQYILSI